MVLCVYLGNDLAEIVEEQTDADIAAWRPSGGGRRIAYAMFPNAYLELAQRRAAAESRRQAGPRSPQELLADVTAAGRLRGMDEAEASARFQRLPEEVRRAAAEGMFPYHRLIQACVDPTRSERSLDPDAEFFATAWPRMEAALDEIRNSAVSAGARFSLVVIPSPLQVMTAAQEFDRSLGYVVRSKWLSNDGRTQHALANWAESRRVPWLDLTAALRASPNACYFVRDGHLTPAGHATVAERLDAWFPPGDKPSGGAP